ncbi:hypothetical protein VTN02DRAFT_6495 [Thermoascus thermophilus]
MRFLTTYSADLSSNPQITLLTTSLANLIAFAVSAGDTFLPDPASYDDLFYKLVETGPIISKFREVYKLSSPSSSSSSSTSSSIKPAAVDLKAPAAGGPTTVAAIDTLLSVSQHFHSLLFHPEKKPADAAAAAADSATPPLPTHRKKKNLSPREVHQIIKQGYDTLSIQAHEGLSAWERWREVDFKPALKRAARVTVEDAKRLVM